MNDYLPKNELDPQDPKKPSANRIMVWIVVTGTWGLIPLNIALWIVYGRNRVTQGQLLAWRQLQRRADPGAFQAIGFTGIAAEIGIAVVEGIRVRR